MFRKDRNLVQSHSACYQFDKIGSLMILDVEFVLVSAILFSLLLAPKT